ncbi:D-Ala-D-Ala carboxypeptidase family metallohydrolase [Blastomonas sp.]|uniref:YcbK family protein n=1 Tax=Blastomonas sp. TaxID=1909299 RepID=UPI00263305C0|nr:D-Ala-D-Ala carboxypeptidase family metallohydrolase [Blastomonas sp.]MDM7954936.1 D-Ala-D-Ala carboxypeptidase family metallohydrolase [Blastomonas sp.]
MSGFDHAAFAEFVTGLNLRFFKPYEFLVTGGRHSDPHSPAFGKNTLPPRELWSNMARTAQVLDAFRLRIGAPVRITNAYRSPEYNRAIGGAKNSQHMKFNALDFVVEGGSTVGQWVRTLRVIRNEEQMFKGGIGQYSSFAHVDTRGVNVDW